MGFLLRCCAFPHTVSGLFHRLDAFNPSFFDHQVSLNSQCCGSRQASCLVRIWNLRPSNSRVVLEILVGFIPPVGLVAVPIVPVLARCLGVLERGRRRLDRGLSFEDLDGQAGRGVPRNMAMHEPRARVVGAEGDDQVASGR
jgi:hypothetical protein